MRIVYCLNTIDYCGGTERIVINKANAFADHYGQDVYIILTDGKGEYQLGNISEKIKIINLHIGYFTDDYKSTLHYLKSLFIKPIHHYKALKKTLRELQPDIVISVGMSEKHVLPYIKGSWKLIREYHFERNYRDLFSKTFLQKTLSKFGRILEDLNHRRFDQTVVLTHEDKETNWKGYDKVTVIPNFIQTDGQPLQSNLENKIVIAVGRLTEQKNFSSLIRAFRKVVDKHYDWVLEIYGDGEERSMLEALIEELELQENVFLKGVTKNINEKYQNSSIFVLSSIMEGFGLVIIEAMAAGLPVVSYDCPCGPKDIINDGETGLLVSTNDENSLANSIIFLIENPLILRNIGQKALTESNYYSLENIMPLWLKLFHNLKSDQI